MTRRRAWVLLVAGGCLVAAGPLLLVVALGSSGWWWSGPQASVPRDGEAHVVRLDGPGTHVLWSDRTLVDPTCEARDARGRAVPVDRVPEDRQVVVGDAETAPVSVAELVVPGDGTLELTCDDLVAQPPATVGIGPALTRGQRWAGAVLTPAQVWAPLAVTVAGGVLAVAGAVGIPRAAPHVRV